MFSLLLVKNCWRFNCQQKLFFLLTGIYNVYIALQCPLNFEPTTLLVYSAFQSTIASFSYPRLLLQKAFLQFSASSKRLSCPLQQELSHDHHLRRSIFHLCWQRPCASNRSAKTEQGKSKTPIVAICVRLFLLCWPLKQKEKANYCTFSFSQL